MAMEIRGNGMLCDERPLHARKQLAGGNDPFPAFEPNGLPGIDAKVRAVDLLHPGIQRHPDPPGKAPGIVGCLLGRRPLPCPTSAPDGKVGSDRIRLG